MIISLTDFQTSKYLFEFPFRAMFCPAKGKCSVERNIFKLSNNSTRVCLYHKTHWYFCTRHGRNSTVAHSIQPDTPIHHPIADVKQAGFPSKQFRKIASKHDLRQTPYARLVYNLAIFPKPLHFSVGCAFELWNSSVRYPFRPVHGPMSNVPQNSGKLLILRRKSTKPSHRRTDPFVIAGNVVVFVTQVTVADRLVGIDTIHSKRDKDTPNN